MFVGGWRRLAQVAGVCAMLARIHHAAAANELARCEAFAGAPYDIVVAPLAREQPQPALPDSPVARIVTDPGYDWALLARAIAPYAASAQPIVGIASTYNPTDTGDKEAGDVQTASGEAYDADGWTAAIQIDLRWLFRGVRYGKAYRPAFALVEIGDKRAVVRINDVGPLAPGRVIDLNERAMRYFDPLMRLGTLAGAKITPLRGRNYVAGPVEAPGTLMAGDAPDEG
jgi:rare lipoprotein A